jgi:hypothetical protein
MYAPATGPPWKSGARLIPILFGRPQTKTPIKRAAGTISRTTLELVYVILCRGFIRCCLSYYLLPGVDIITTQTISHYRSKSQSLKLKTPQAFSREVIVLHVSFDERLNKPRQSQVTLFALVFVALGPTTIQAESCRLGSDVASFTRAYCCDVISNYYNESIRL